MKKSKITTLIVQDLEDLKRSLDDFDGDVEIIQMAPSNKEDAVSALIEQLTELTLWTIVAKPDPILEDLGIHLPYHAVDPIIVSDINLTADPDNILFNGVVKIPKKSVEEVNIIGTHFLDEELATQICTELNIYTNARVDKIYSAIGKSRKFRGDIAKENMS